MKVLILLAFSGLFHFASQSQEKEQLELIDSSQKVSFRGLSVVSDSIIWVSGSKGTVGKSLDAGRSWKWFNVKGFESSDFRDIEAFSASEAVIMAVAEPAQILRTEDGGEHWNIVFSDSSKGMFLDAMDFRNSKEGIVIGDPIDGKAFIAVTRDAGKNWKQVLTGKEAIRLETGEAFFAASGSNVHLYDSNRAFFVTGGKSSRFWDVEFTDSNTGTNLPIARTIALPMKQGKETTGANGMLAANGILFSCGGDFNNDKDSTGSFTFSYDIGKTWLKANRAPAGYRSSLCYTRSRFELVACGTSGVDGYDHNSFSWIPISNESYHVCATAPDGRTIYFAGGKGRIGRLVLRQ